MDKIGISGDVTCTTIEQLPRFTTTSSSQRPPPDNSMMSPLYYRRPVNSSTTGVRFAITAISTS